MREDSAPGEDEIPSVLIKSCKSSLSYPLLLLWDYSFQTGHINSEFLCQLITPVFKGGSKLVSTNYRPVSLTSHLMKIFERVLQKKIMKYLEENNYISCSQHGFRKGRSCLSELLAHFTNLYENLGNCSDSDTVYLDFSKAFDKVDHALLIKKLQKYGFGGKLLKWIEAFLSNHTQKVVIDGKVSETIFVISGVPQGTVLGPLLFLLFVNDMELCIKHSNLKLFADDSRLTKDINPEVPDADQDFLQQDLNAILDWAISNNMILNEKKFQLLVHRVHKHAPNRNMRLLQQLPFADYETSRSYSLPNNQVLDESDLVTDLGISVPNGFIFEAHINQIAKKANLKCSWILSVFRCRQEHAMMTLFRSLVLSILEYCSALWSPHRVQDISKLEGVQRRFTSKISSISHLNYWDRLKRLNLMSLQRRRERFQMIYVWKVLNDKVPNDFDITYNDSLRRGKTIVIPTMPSRIAKINTTYDTSFKVHAARLWNCLSIEVKSATSLDVFKKRLDIFLLGLPDCPPVPGYSTLNSNSVLDWLSSNIDIYTM